MTSLPITSAPKICVARGDMLGDVVVTTSAVNKLKSHYPNAQIYYLTRSHYHPLLEGLDSVSGVIEDTLPYHVAWSDRHELYSLADHLKQFKFDCFIGFWEAPQYAWLAKLAGIPVRIGHMTSLVNRLLYTHKVSLDYRDFTRHKVDYNESLLTPLGIPQSDQGLCLNSTSYLLNPFLEEHNLKEKEYIVINLDAGILQRVLLTHHVIRLVKWMIESRSEPIVLVGLERTVSIAQEIEESFNQSSRVINVVNKLDLSQITACIDQAKLLITADTGLAHIAASVQTPVIVHYFNRIQNPLHWGPWKVPHAIVKTIHGCIDVCRPQECQKLDCREPFELHEYQEAIDRLTTQPELLPNQRHYWFKKSVVVGLNHINTDLTNHLNQDHWQVGPMLQGSIRDMKRIISTQNMNLILISSSVSWWERLKIMLACHWASNFMTFFPIVMKVSNAFDFELAVAQKLDSVENA